MTNLRTRMSRQRILEGAWHILDEGRLDDLTVDAIARALHMSKSTLYKYFTSKEDVIVGIVEHACASTQKDARAAARQIDGREVDVALPIVLDLYGAHGDRLPAGILLAQRQLPPSSTALMNETWAQLHELCAAAVSRSGNPLAAKALSTSARAALDAAAAREVDLARGEAVRSLRGLFQPGLATVVTA